MTTISAPRTHALTTPFERTLLLAASALDRFVSARMERRAGVDYRRAHDVRRRFAEGRDGAQARGAIGLLPR